MDCGLCDVWENSNSTIRRTTNKQNSSDLKENSLLKINKTANKKHDKM